MAPEPNCKNGEPRGQAVHAAEDPPTYAAATSVSTMLPELPQHSAIVVHLKLLHAFHKLRLQILNDETFLGFGIDHGWLLQDSETSKAQLLEHLATRRWHVFVQRAVFRFESWWRALRQLTGGRLLTMAGLMTTKPVRLDDTSWCGKNIDLSYRLPPLDVLMVWHSFSLSPRRYVEDCMLQGMMTLWHSGLPWNAIDQSLTNLADDDIFSPGIESVIAFETLRPWQNADDPCLRMIICPKCGQGNETLCTEFPARLENVKAQLDADASLIDQVASGVWDQLYKSKGWADPGFKLQCKTCGMTIKEDTLRAGKLINDIMRYAPKDSEKCSGISTDLDRIRKLRPMPGTFLDSSSGLPRWCEWRNNSEYGIESWNFPNLLAATLSHVDIGGRRNTLPSWEYTISSMRFRLRQSMSCNWQMQYATSCEQRRTNTAQEDAMKRCMSYYNTNSSSFTLDLASAVQRQANFIQKMQQIDWLHSPSLHATIEKLLEKYERFFQILKNHPGEATVPTLDVDLAWHTHQLSPLSYYKYSLAQTGRFVNHDDQISEFKLSEAFTRTSKIYQKMYGSPYSECMCWYCAAVYTGVSSSSGPLLSFGRHKSDCKLPIAADDHTTAHVSTHNAIILRTYNKRHHDQEKAHAKWLMKHREKAVQQARKEGREIRIPPSGSPMYDTKIPGVIGPVDGSQGIEDRDAHFIKVHQDSHTIKLRVRSDGWVHLGSFLQEVDTDDTSACVTGGGGGGTSWGGIADDNGGSRFVDTRWELGCEGLG